eukprot:m.161852 g.161852  ORF g.161852 m.161852 type:complete len:96 (+) comp23849_c2_seq1:5081-5368(+)
MIVSGTAPVVVSTANSSEPVVTPASFSFSDRDTIFSRGIFAATAETDPTAKARSNKRATARMAPCVDLPTGLNQLSSHRTAQGLCDFCYAVWPRW